MANIITRSSVLALVIETTEGTLKAPSSTGDYIALQTDFAMTPEFEVLTNDEIRSSIAQGKPILGLENPSANFSHYLRHSGTEGAAANYSKKLLYAAFGGEEVESTEYNTVNSSTTSVINVDTGEGADFRKGEALLIKDGTNGYSIRPVHSISSDALTMGFNIDTAPSSGVNLGKAITYYPANTGHSTLSLWHYLGNGGAIQALAGGRVTDCSISFEAGQMINTSYTVEGVSYYFNPFIITSANKYLDFNQGGSELNATVTEAVYKDPHDLASAVQTAMNAVGTGITVTYSDSTGKFTIVKASGTLELLWKTGVHGSDNTDTHIGSTLGYTDSANDTGGLTYTADSVIDIDSPQTPSYDDTDPLAAKDNTVFIGDADDNVCFAASSVNFTMSTPKADLLSVCEESGKAGSVISSREVTIEVSARLAQYDVSKFLRFRENTETRFMYNFGVKSGGNWVAGKCGCLYVAAATISSFEVADEDGLVILNFTLSAFAPSDGTGEVFLSFV